MNQVVDFYDTHKESLEEKYPGITKRQLERIIGHSSLPHSLLRNYLHLGVPLPYIVNQTFFHRCEFFIDFSVFIPRFETELLVEMAVDELKKIKKKKPRFVDVGTGTGAVFLSILRQLDFPVSVYAVDICPHALSVARKNTWRHQYGIHPETDMVFMNSDRLDNIEDSLDLIVSNPPYVKEKEDIQEVHIQVKTHEPHGAVFLPDEEYASWYKDFLSNAFNLLENNGILLMEGHEKHLMDIKQVALKAGFMDVCVDKDYNGRNRYVKAVKRIHG